MSNKKKQSEKGTRADPLGANPHSKAVAFLFRLTLRLRQINLKRPNPATSPAPPISHPITNIQVNLFQNSQGIYVISPTEANKFD